ncbi:acyl-CoA transferase [Duganella sp. SAP-35]|uniref:Acyl-CoA transferase n=2 Tax=Duganella aceris TaxID=2703883 RepID=A0ABX0FH45_9BURK|nr:acyl-CoA transferase [Duganella aceris]
MLDAASAALGLPDDAADAVVFGGVGDLPSCFATTDLAAASVAAAALAVRQLIVAQGGAGAEVRVDRRLASLWFGWSLHPVGWERPPLWDAVAGDYACADGWIRLHTNARHHRDAALAVLGCAAEREAVTRAVAAWRGEDLEAAVVGQGGCAAMMRSMAQWREHPQGRAVAAEPLIAISAAAAAAPAAAAAAAAAADSRPASAPAAPVLAAFAAGAHVGRGWPGTPSRPLAGLKVLDLTRVLAGPVATRFLAGYGADVLRIDPPGWTEPGVIPEVTLGKRCARLDLTLPVDRAIFEGLLADADILVHGYRADALERLGFGEQTRRQLNPGLIDVALDAYGWSGPWAGRRGFDSLVQMSSGIARHGMLAQGTGKPVPLPVQALDHATGYLIAAAVVRGLLHRLDGQDGMQARLSLARVAELLVASSAEPAASASLAAAVGLPPIAPGGEADLSPQLEQTEWGPARRYWPPAEIDGAPMRWERPASSLGSAAPSWGTE